MPGWLPAEGGAEGGWVGRPYGSITGGQYTINSTDLAVCQRGIEAYLRADAWEFFGVGKLWFSA
jgi:hypothetical protein